MIPVSWLKMFDPYELNTLISGSCDGFDVSDLRQHTVLSGGYQARAAGLNGFRRKWTIFLNRFLVFTPFRDCFELFLRVFRSVLLEFGLWLGMLELVRRTVLAFNGCGGSCWETQLGFASPGGLWCKASMSWTHLKGLRNQLQRPWGSSNKQYGHCCHLMYVFPLRAAIFLFKLMLNVDRAWLRRWGKRIWGRMTWGGSWCPKLIPPNAFRMAVGIALISLWGAKI